MLALKLDIGVEVGLVAAEAPNDGAVDGGDLVQRESATAGDEVVAVGKFVDGVEVAEHAAVSTLEEYDSDSYTSASPDYDVHSSLPSQYGSLSSS